LTVPASRRLPALAVLHARLDACTACPEVVGPVVHGPALRSRILLVGQAPGPHEGALGRPFAWTAGKTLFRWFATLGVDEATFRARVYMSAVTRCFPGKAKGGGDRVPSRDEIERCRVFLAGEVDALHPRLLLPVGGLAIGEVLGERPPLEQVVGRRLRVRWHGAEADAICLPHPSGASTWFKKEPGRSLLGKALALVGRHEEWRAAFR
jgi:uracil-DNA glycosylase